MPAASATTNSAPPSPRFQPASVHSNGQVAPRHIVKLNPSIEASPVARELVDFVNRESSSPETEIFILSQILAALKILTIFLQADNSIQPIDTIIESCRKLKLIGHSEVFTCTETASIEDACKELGGGEEERIGFAKSIFISLLVELQDYFEKADSPEQAITIALRNIIDKTLSTNKKNTSNIIDNTPINKRNFTQKKHLEDMCLLQRPFVAFGRVICEIWISLLESIKAFAKAAQAFITNYTTAEGREKRELEKLKNDLSNHTIRIFTLLPIIV